MAILGTVSAAVTKSLDQLKLLLISAASLAIVSLPCHSMLFYFLLTVSVFQPYSGGILLLDAPSGIISWS